MATVGDADVPGRDVVDRIACWGVRAAWTAALAGAVTNLIDFRVYGLRVRLLDMTTHASVFGAVSLLALAGASGMAALLAGRTRRTLGALVLPLLLAALLVLRVFHPSHVFLLALPIAAATFAVLWQYGAASASPARRLIRAGCGTLAVSYVVHASGGSIVATPAYGTGSWPYELKEVLAHSSELAGWIVVAAGLAAAFAALTRSE